MRWAVALALAACGTSAGKTIDGGAAASGSAATAARGLDAAAAGDPRAYKAALHKGWELARKGDDQGALAAFEGALTAQPDDARAMTELSWEALLTGDLDRAQAMADRALAVGTDPKVRAMGLYNLGRVAEARGDHAKALADYQQSLQLRPNRTVDRRAQRLGATPTPTAVGGPGPVAPGATALSGPFADLVGFCADLGLPVADSDDPTLEDDVWCATEGQATTAPAPFDRALIVRHSDGAGEVTSDLALHAAPGWFVLVDVGATPPTRCTLEKKVARCS